MADAVFFNIFNGGRNRLLDIHSVQEAGVHHLAFLRVEAFLADVAALDQRDDRQVEFFGERIVAAVVGRDRHYRARAVAREDIFGNPDRDSAAGHRVHAVGAAEHARDSLGLGDPLALRLLLHRRKVLIHGRFLFRSGQNFNEVALRRKHHKGHAEHRVRAGCEYGDVVFGLAVVALEDSLAAVGLADPVALHLLKGVGPVYSVKSFKKPSGIGRDAQLPLLHLLLLHRETSAHGKAVLDLVVGQYGPESGAPVHRGLALIGDAVVHQSVGFLFL